MLIFPPSWHVFDLLKGTSSVPRAQLFEAHSFGHPEFFYSNTSPADTVPTHISTMAGSRGSDRSRPTFRPQLSCLWQRHRVLCVPVLATNQGNPAV